MTTTRHRIAVAEPRRRYQRSIEAEAEVRRLLRDLAAMRLECQVLRRQRDEANDELLSVNALLIYETTAPWWVRLADRIGRSWEHTRG